MAPDIMERVQMALWVLAGGMVAALVAGLWARLRG